MYDVIVEQPHGKQEVVAIYPTAGEARTVAATIAKRYPRVTVCTKDGYLLEEYVGGRPMPHIG